MSVDHLFDVRNAFFLGHYQQCIHEAQKLIAKTDEDRLAKDVFMYRSYIAQGKASVVLSEIPERPSSKSLKAVRQLAEYQIQLTGIVLRTKCRRRFLKALSPTMTCPAL